MLQIYIYGRNESGYLDMLPGTELEMENNTPLFDEDLSSGEFSLPVDFPWTEKNRRLMGFAERIQNFDDDTPYWVVDVYDKGFPELVHAKLTLLEKSGDLGFSRGSFNASISGNKGLFGSAIRNKTLRNVDMGAEISFADECRKFATDHMKGLYPQYNHIAFAPLVNENFFDQSKNYNGEFLARDTLNDIVRLGTGDSNWVFGRPKSTNAALPTSPGDVEHIDYRTVPFFKFQYVLTRAFEAAGYTAMCDICTNPAYKDLYIFNNVAIEFYTPAVYADYNRKIVPADHLPDMPLADFFQAVFAFFNLFPTFSSNNNIEVHYRQQVLSSRRVLDVTDRAANFFTATYTDKAENNGYTLDYEWEGPDDYYNDRVKDIDPAAVVATVNSVPQLATLSIGRPLTTDDIVFVTNENMYYKPANVTTTPILWDAWSERLGPLVNGKGDRTEKVPIGTLCNFVELDKPNALYVRRYKLATRQVGSYWNNKFVKVKNDFGLRLFYITPQQVNGNLVPVSHNHNTTPNGTVLAPYSLALQGPQSIGATFHSAWQKLRNSSNTVKLVLRADKKLMKELTEYNTLQVNNILYLPMKTERTIPLKKTIDVEILPL